MTEESQTQPMTNTPEARTTTGEIIDQSAPAPETPAAPAAPEAYADFNLPEGLSVDKTILDEATPIFKELNLPQEAAQKLVDIYTKQMSGTKDSAIKAVETQRTEWRDAVKADKDIGAVLDSKVLPAIGRLKAQLPSDVRDAFNAAMDFTGAGDHPGVVKALYKIAELVGEGTHVTGVGPSPLGQGDKPSRPSIAGALYPNLQR
jgi:hypothetical protein